MDNAPTQAPASRRQAGAEGRIRQLIRRQKTERGQLLEVIDETKKEAEYMRRVTVMLIPLVPKPIVARILQDARGENENARIQ